MKLSAVLRPTRDTETVPPPDPAREHERQVREARLDVARQRLNWTEIPDTRLVRRGPFLVDAETDLVWVVRRGHVFEPYRATVGYVRNDTPMTFYVDAASGEIVFIEPVSGGRTWTEILERKARQGRTT